MRHTDPHSNACRYAGPDPVAYADAITRLRGSLFNRDTDSDRIALVYPVGTAYAHAIAAGLAARYDPAPDSHLDDIGD